MEMRLSSLVLGIVGIVFGLLALVLPELTLATFSALYLLIMVAGIVVFLFLAITSRSDESMFWFGISAALLILGAFSFFIENLAALILIIFIVGIAAYSGYVNVIITLSQEKSQIRVVVGMFASGVILLAGLLWYFPNLEKNLILTVVGNFSLVFGIFSLLIGWYTAYDHEREARAAAAGSKEHAKKRR
jgi:uncharacterized membrane protein HdeD (DUF308 family)